jgi:hypothetical protein
LRSARTKPSRILGHQLQSFRQRFAENLTGVRTMGG